MSLDTKIRELAVEVGSYGPREITGRDSDLMKINLDPHSVHAPRLFPDVDIETLEEMVDTVFEVPQQPDAPIEDRKLAEFMIMSAARHEYVSSDPDDIDAADATLILTRQQAARYYQSRADIEEQMDFVDNLFGDETPESTLRPIKVPGVILTPEEALLLDPDTTPEEDAQFERDLAAITEAERAAVKEAGTYIY